MFYGAAVMTPTEVTEKLGLLRMKDRSWYCHPSNALEGDGLFEGRLGIAPSKSEYSRADIHTCTVTGLSWLSQNIKKSALYFLYSRNSLTSVYLEILDFYPFLALLSMRNNLFLISLSRLL